MTDRKTPATLSNGRDLTVYRDTYIARQIEKIDGRWVAWIDVAFGCEQFSNRTSHQQGYKTKAEATKARTILTGDAKRWIDRKIARYEAKAAKPAPASSVNEEEENAVIDRAMQILETRIRYSKKDTFFTSPDATKKFLQLKLTERKREHFGVLFMDTRHGLIAYEEMFHGTIDAAHVHPREVVRRALEHNAAACIITHNHPSGNPEPSQADLAITRRLRDALALVDIRLLDHFICGSTVCSLAERGLV